MQPDSAPPGIADVDLFAPTTPALQGWSAAPDCAACGDQGRLATRFTPEREITPELLHQMEQVFLGAAAQPDDNAIRKGLGAVLEKVLTPAVTRFYCDCKKGRLGSELWYSSKHGLHHPDAPDPEPDDDGY